MPFVIKCPTRYHKDERSYRDIIRAIDAHLSRILCILNATCYVSINMDDKPGKNFNDTQRFKSLNINWCLYWLDSNKIVEKN